MSRIFKAPNVQINQDSFRINNAPVQFNQELKQQSSLRRNTEASSVEFEEINDSIDFGTADFEIAEQNRLNNVHIEDEETQAEANSIIENAQEMAEQIIENAKQEAESIKDEILEESKKEGFETGYAEGTSKAETEMQETLNTELAKLDEERANIEVERQKLYKDVESEVADVIGTVVENILTNAFEVDSTLIIQLIKIGLKQSTISNEVNIKVSNDLLDFVNENLQDIKSVVGSDVTINVVSDVTLGDNECIIETDMGYIKCNLESIIESLKFNLKTLYNS